MRHSEPEEFLAVDVGAARVGVARGSSAARIAQPLKTVAAVNIITELQNLINQNQVSGIVVGLPRNLEGKDTAQTQAVRNWAEQAKTVIGLPFYWQDEALTSRVAESRNSAPSADASAAAIILQDFLDGAENDRVVI